ncbi:DUF4395 domain-containing protein [Pseudactinotalea suaedae]|uniref:DUF4395 domain-containing protein n=1 Tax=Pseudactinotalea suaedae TaxID=1524924 RepID=UPI0012E1135F|nr:DUF4395 domain-containing protein [Pseudactinotalea suaedae]
MSVENAPDLTARGIDPRGPRFGAALTAVLLVVAILLGPGTGTIVLAVVAASFLLGAIRGPQGTWQGLLFAALVRPRLAPPAELESPEPPTFAQVVGLVITGLGLGLTLLGATWALTVFGVLALAAAALNALTGFCLGCEIYLLLRRLATART